jgi:hypothetical protein
MMSEFSLPYWFHPVAYTVLSLYVAGSIVVFYLQYRRIKENVIELETIPSILQEHSDIEKRDEKLAMVLGMTKEQFKIELEQTDRLALIGRKIASVTARLKAVFPINYER